MSRLPRPRLTYANVIATLALFISLGGVGYAAAKFPANSVGTAQLKKSSVTSVKVADHSLTGADIKASTLGVVPNAAHAITAGQAAPSGTAGGALTGSYPNPSLASNAVTTSQVVDSSLTGADIADGSIGAADLATSLRATRPAGTLYLEGACLETTERAADVWSQAEANCESIGGHLPSPEQLYGLRAQPGITLDAPTGEWTGHFWSDTSGDNTSPTTTVYVELISQTGFNKKAILGGAIGYRCSLPTLS